MKTQQEFTIQFSGYPLRIAETKPKDKKIELTIAGSATEALDSLHKNSITDDPGNWDVDWFNSYE